jgi:hypothetical protein
LFPGRSRDHLRTRGARPRAVGCFAIAGALLLCGSASAAAAAVRRVGPLPFADAQVAVADNGEAAVTWQTGPFVALQASLGTPGGAFTAPVTLAPLGSSPLFSSVAMDAAGDALIVWEQTSPDAHGGESSSLGIFAAARGAGGALGKPVRIAGPQHEILGQPLLAMNRRGDELVTWRQGSRTLIATGHGGSVPTAIADLGVPRFDPTPGAQFFDVETAALDEAGNATFAGTDAVGHPVVLERSAAGSAGPPTALDTIDVRNSYRGIAVGVGPQGQAVAIWRGQDGVAHAATRPAAGAPFGVPATVAFGGPLFALSAGIDGQGRAVVAGVANIARHSVLQVARAATGTAFDTPVSLSDPSRDASAPTSLSVAANGGAAVAWLETVNGDAVARVALSHDGGAFAPTLTLKPATDEAADVPAVAVDGAGRVVPVWTSVAGDIDRVLAASIAGSAVSGPTVIAQATAPRRVAAGRYAPRVDVGVAQSLRIQSNGHIRPLLVCSAPAGVKCRGTVRIDRPKRGHRPRLHVASARFVLARGAVRRITMRATRAARHAAARATLDCIIAARTANPAGAATTSSEELFVVKRRP